MPSSNYIKVVVESIFKESTHQFNSKLETMCAYYGIKNNIQYALVDFYNI
jgi:hypothetical protein